MGTTSLLYELVTKSNKFSSGNPVKLPTTRNFAGQNEAFFHQQNNNKNCGKKEKIIFLKLLALKRNKFCVICDRN